MKVSQLRQIIREETKRALNEGPLVTTTKVSEKDIKNSVANLEIYLWKIGNQQNIKWNWSKLGDLLADIIHEARMLGGYDDKTLLKYKQKGNKQ
jgi:hypothetical protein